MPYPVKSVANAIINRAKLDGEKITHLKLQKLLYYACGYYLAAYDEPLIDHTFEAWDYGPVVPALYHEFKTFGNKPITRFATEYDWESGAETPAPIVKSNKNFEKVLDFVWKTYGSRSASQLSAMTHSKGSPWDETRKENPGIRDADIPREKLKKHFARFVKTKEKVV